MASKGTGIYRRGRELTYSEVKEQVRQWTGWSESEYKKNYDILRNKLRTYEKFNKYAKEQSPSKVLYYWQRAKATDPNYQEGPAMQRLLKFPSYSSGQAQKKLESQKVESRLSNIFSKATTSAFEELINTSPVAAKLADEISDPVELEKALADFAEELHKRQIEAKKAAIPQSVGSDIYFDFKYSNHLTKE